MYDYQTIRSIHFELSDKCNASCPQCARNQSGGKVNPHLPLVELTLADIKTILPTDLILQLKSALFCGNYGDPILAKEMLEILEYLKSINPGIHLSINTNGSARDTKWWHRLGEILQGNGKVKFGIDGLIDTHHLYRKGTDFNKIIRNAEAFVQGGGHAIWEYIVFRHNEHQIEEARELANQIGFKNFVVKKTGRFFSNSKLEKKDYQDVLDENNLPQYRIELPLNQDFHNVSFQKEELLISKYGNLQNYLDSTDIGCKTSMEKSLYVSSEGLLFPCCWTANQMYVWYLPKGSTPVSRMLEKSGGPDAINAKIFPIKDIIKGSFFNSIQESWSCKSIKEGKLQVCSKTCGTVFDQFKGQYE